MNVPGMEKIACGLALLLATGSAVWSGADGPAVASSRRPNPRMAAFGAVESMAPVGPPRSWPAPVALQREEAWIYEVFTPPVIYHDAHSGRYSVVSPRTEMPAASPGAHAPGIDLVAVKRAPFRLQLVGYFGGEDSYAGAFENVHTGEIYLARAGRMIPELGLRIVAFGVERQAVPIPDSMTSNEPVATAVVQDTSSGEVTVLTNQDRVSTGRGRAVLQLGHERPTLLEAAESEEIQLGDSRYKIEKIRLAPAAVDISKLTADGAVAERRTLVPSLPLTPATRDSEPLP